MTRGWIFGDTTRVSVFKGMKGKQEEMGLEAEAILHQIPVGDASDYSLEQVPRGHADRVPGSSV